jgi:hypothetical protein
MSFFPKNREQEGKAGPIWGLVPVGWGKKGCRRMYMVKILLHIYVNGKMRLVETIPGMRRR